MTTQQLLVLASNLVCFCLSQHWKYQTLACWGALTVFGHLKLTTSIHKPSIQYFKLICLLFPNSHSFLQHENQKWHAFRNKLLLNKLNKKNLSSWSQQTWQIINHKQFSSRWYGIFISAFSGKSICNSTFSQSSFPNVAYETVPVLVIWHFIGSTGTAIRTWCCLSIAMHEQFATVFVLFLHEIMK